MTTATRNKAAERLQSFISERTRSISEAALLAADVQEALAAERRATVERIRRAVEAVIEDEDRPEEYLWAMLSVQAILNEEAAR